MHEATRRRLFLVGRVLFVVVLAVVLVGAAARHYDQLREVSLEPRPHLLLAAAPFTFLGGLLLPAAWRHVLGAYGATLPRAAALRVWCLSQASRFVPGNVALVASRVLLSSREGVPKSLAAASLALEVGLIVVWSGLLSSWLPSTWLPGPLRLLAAVAAAVVLISLPRLVRVVGRLLPRFPAIAPGALSTRHLYEATALYGLNALVRSLGFVLVTMSLHTIDPRDVFLIIGAVNAGAVLGMVGITPAGLGVREGVVAALLAHRFGVGDAATFAVAYRAWDFLFELVWIGIALVWERRTRPRAETVAGSR